MLLGSSLEVFDARILKVKMDLNSDAQFESYSFSIKNCIVINSKYMLAGLR